ncbi:MAG TPA: alpha/beta hydrolase [Gaiellaceae bacterium]|nr:alpha/beta hydrolase [Gaiellaceae bacterium]
MRISTSPSRSPRRALLRYAATGDGVRLAYEESGDGEPLIFIHGLAYDRFGWGPLPALLSPDFRVVVLDNRGVGDSDVPDGPYSVQQMAADVVAVLDAAGIDVAHVFGVSLGGFIAQKLALAHPERVRKLVLCSTSPGGPHAFPMPARGQDAFGRFPSMEREAGLRIMAENSLGDHAVRERPELVEEVYAYRLERSPSVDAWHAQLAASRGHDAYERVAAISAPTLVIHALADTVIDARNGELLAEQIPGARLELVPDRGHLVMWQEGERLAPIVRDFLRG